MTPNVPAPQDATVDGDSTLGPSTQPGSGRVPLSRGQEQLWVLHQRRPRETAYNELMATRLTGVLNLQALDRSIRSLIARHESLRTRFFVDNGTPYQSVDAMTDFRLELADLSTIGSQEWGRAVDAAVDEELARPFDLEGPLFRVKLIRLGEHEHVLLLGLHHIIADGWSHGVITRDLSTLYEAYYRGVEPALPDLRMQYAGYVRSQLESLRSGTVLPQLSYWIAQLAESETLQLPTDYTRPAVPTLRGRTIYFSFADELATKLNTLAKAQRVTLYTVVLAAFHALLARLSGEHDILVATPYHGRSHRDLEGVVGHFVNMLLLRAQVSEELTFLDLVKRVNDVALSARSNADIPFETVLEALRPKRESLRQPPFQVVFAWQTGLSAPFELAGLTCSDIPLNSTISKFDLSFYMQHDRGTLRGTMEYSADIFCESTVNRMIAYWTHFLEGVVSDPNSLVWKVTLMSEAERHQILVHWNSTRAGYPRDACIHELFEEQARRSPEAVALVEDGRKVTYRELNDSSTQLAHHLVRDGLAPGECVPIIMARSTDMVVAQLAVLKSGGVYVPVDPSLPRQRMQFILNDCGAHRILGGQKRYCGLRGAPFRYVDVAEVLQSDGEPRADKLITPKDALTPALVMYTSGSTGDPNGVVVPHRAVTRLIINNGYSQIGSTDCVAYCSNPAFDASTFEVWGPLLSGARILVVPQGIVVDVWRLAAVLKEQGVTVLWLSAGTFSQYADRLGGAIGQLRYLLVGGDVVEPSVVRRTLLNNPPGHLLNCYGPTECTTFSSTHDIKSVDEKTTRVPIGKPISNTRMYILDTQFQPVPVGVPGEIFIGGDGVAIGYLNRPELTKDRFVPDPFETEPDERLYRSGDLGRWLADGTIEFLGRRDGQVKIRGYRVEPGEIAAQLLRHPHIVDAVVVPRHNEAGGKRLTAYVVAKVREIEMVPDTESPSAAAGMVAHRTESYDDESTVDRSPQTFVVGRSAVIGESAPVSHTQRAPAEPLEESLTRRLVPQLRKYLSERLPEYMVPFNWILLGKLPLTPNGKVDIRALPIPNQRARDALDEKASSDTLVRTVAEMFAKVLKSPYVREEDDFFELGGHSLTAMNLTLQIEGRFAVKLPPHAVYHNPTARLMANCVEHLLSEESNLPLPREHDVEEGVI